ncbi:hypothetical protein H0H92_007916 [Tricholoma furcatifolium]|nr:hypothetical protein H0H92_007916 [Tricholoma furcatifolium]
MAFNIPRPLPFSDVKFSTIGQDPPLLKRISAADPQLTHNSSPSPPPELHYPSHTDSPRQSSRPTLFQTLTFSQRPELILSDSTQTGPLFRQPSSSLSHESAPMILPRAVPPQTHISPPSHGEPSTRVSATCSNISNPIPSSSVVTPPSAPTEATNPQTHSSYARLRALQTRLVTSLSNLAPPDMSNTLLRVQMANAQSASALTTAHRSHILAQQSLATSREAVAAAQESLNAAEQAQTHANDALVAVKQLASASEATDAEGNLNRHWRVNFTQLQDDLRLFGDWIREREREEASSRQEARRLEAPVLNNDQVEAVTNSDLRQRVWRANGAEGLQRIAVSEAEMVTEGSTAPLVRKISSNQGQIEQATKAWGLETRATNHKIAVDVDTEPMAIDADIAKHLPPETSRDDHSSLLRSFRDQLPESPSRSTASFGTTFICLVIDRHDKI